MCERAAHLDDGVFESVPVRQWVLTLPHRLRYRLAYDHRLCRAVLGVYARALLSFQRRLAREQGVDGRGGAVTASQRCGSALNMNIHFHTRWQVTRSKSPRMASCCYGCDVAGGMGRRRSASSRANSWKDWRR